MKRRLLRVSFPAAMARRRDRSDAGFTLIEMLITMVIFGIVLAITMGAVIQAQKYSTQVQDTADATSELRQALAVVDRQVRSGNVLFSPASETSPSTCTASGASGGTCMRIYTQSNGLNRCVQWQLLTQSGTTVLRSRSWSPNWVSDGSYTGWHVDARNLVPTATPFSLRDSSGNPTSADANGTTGRYLSVTLSAVDPRRAGKTETITSSMSGRNTNYGFNGALCSPTPPGG
jgi:prepilin-type N-terminal cleavage/methylation domain-containing protein